MRIVVLGCGFIGSEIAKDLARKTDFSVTVADILTTKLDTLRNSENITSVRVDLSSPEKLKEIVRQSDLVIGALPGFVGYSALKTVIEEGKNIVDISFFPEDPFLLDDLAKEKGVTAVIDCGLAPGLCNTLMGHVNSLLDETTSYTCFVGGLPVTRKKPFEYAAVFSPSDVIEEYTRPVHMIENGQIVIRPALSEIEHIEFDEIGVLEAFNTDGLRTLTRTMKTPFMKEKTLRYPGHADLMRVFRDAGFFDKNIIDLKGTDIRPLDLTVHILSSAWELGKDEMDMSVMRVIIEGKAEGKPVQYTFNMLDRYDQTTGATSMARTTGYMCAVTARLIAEGFLKRRGVIPPEYLGEDKAVYDRIMKGLREKKIVIRETRTGFPL